MFGQEVGYVKLLSEQSETVSFKQFWAASLPRSHDTFWTDGAKHQDFGLQTQNPRDSGKCITDIFLSFNCSEVHDSMGHSNILQLDCNLTPTDSYSSSVLVESYIQIVAQ
jgi:hypothetical protein